VNLQVVKEDEKAEDKQSDTDLLIGVLREGLVKITAVNLQVVKEDEKAEDKQTDTDLLIGVCSEKICQLFL
jgi:hypothetical protein